MLYKMNRDDISPEQIPKFTDRVNYNLFYRIQEGEEVRIFADKRHKFIAMQNPGMQMWIWSQYWFDDKRLQNCLTELLQHFEQEESLSIVSDFGILNGFTEMELKHQIKKIIFGMFMLPYFCPKAYSTLAPVGVMQSADESHKEIVGRYLVGFMKDCFNTVVTLESQLDRAEILISNGGLFLWQSGKDFPAMANVAHKAGGFARINCVYTPPEFRNKGYSKMLMSALTQTIINQGLLPMLYADLSNPSSNEVYRKCGYINTGLMKEYVLLLK